jgi:hypothetical protein
MSHTLDSDKRTAAVVAADALASTKPRPSGTRPPPCSASTDPAIGAHLASLSPSTTEENSDGTGVEGSPRWRG